MEKEEYRDGKRLNEYTFFYKIEDSEDDEEYLDYVYAASEDEAKKMIEEEIGEYIYFTFVFTELHDFK